MKRVLLALLPFFLTCGCAHVDKTMVYTEAGLRAAESSWDAAYNAKADECEKKYEPQTPEMEECFGPIFDADEKVEIALESSVALLRSYWVARAAGEKPDLMKVLREISKIVKDLPPEAKRYFDKVKGIP